MKNKIMVVDDNPDLREVISIFLGGEGYDVICCENGEEALEALDDTVDLVILDVMMPGMSGYKVCAQIRERSMAPVLFLTAKTQDSDKSMGFSAGGHLAAHYSNRYNIPEVCEVIKNPIKPAFSVLCYPVISENALFYHKNSFINLLGHEPSEAEKEEFSAENMVSENTPPTFIWTTAEDKSVPNINSILYAEKLSLFGVPFALHIYPTGGHGLSVVNETVPFKETKVINPPDYHNAVWVEELKHFIRTFAYRG